MRPPPNRRAARPDHPARLRALLLLLILATVAVMGALHHGGEVALPKLLALGLVPLIYAFVRLEPPSRRGPRRLVRPAA